jgi:cytochrome c oxidase subunit 2
VNVVTNGSKQTLTTDRAYLEKAILEPNADIVEGFPPAMPSYAGRIPAEDMTGILDYLMDSKGGEAAAEPATEEKPAAQPTPESDPEKEEADKKVETPAAPTDPVERGKTLASQNGCLGCHSTDGTRKVGPSFKGLVGSERTVTKDGQSVKVQADTDYLIRAIREPGAEVTEGYPPAMPPYPGLSDDDIKAMQSWMETLE